MRERGDSGCGVDGMGAGLLGEFAALGIQRNRDVGIAWRGAAEQVLEMDLPRGRVEQIRAAHDVCDALFAVVDHHGKLVGIEPVGPPQHEVADVALQHLRDAALDPILETELHGVGTHAQRACSATCETVPAGAGIHRRAIRCELSCRVRNLGARARAGIDIPCSPQCIERGLIVLAPHALVQNFAIPLKSECFQCAQDGISSAGLGAGLIEVLDPDQPLALCGARIQPACQRCHERTEVKRARGRGCKAPSVARRRAAARCLRAFRHRLVACCPRQSAKVGDATRHRVAISNFPRGIMATLELTKENFEQTVTSNPIVIVDFWAPWCGPCRGFAPVFEQSSEHHTDVVYAKVDTDAEPEIAGAFNIRSIPTLMVFRENVVLYQEAGALPAASLEQVVSQVKAIDMAKVHAEIASREQADAAAKPS